VSPHLANDLVDEWAKIRRGDGRIISEPERLTSREKEVLQLIAEGNSSKEMADLLSVSVRTVEHHRANIMNKLNLKKTADLVKYALQKGYA
jgi:DNA-binding NarL/FixJ family response regulator